MSKENSIFINGEIVKDYKKVTDAHAKTHIAGIVGGVSLGATLIFPAAIGGSLVGFGEALRQGKKMFTQMDEFDRKYPQADKKSCVE